MYIKALELTNDEDRLKLLELYGNGQDEASKIAEVKKIFVKNGLDALLTEQIEKYTLEAFQDIEGLSIQSSKKLILKSFGLGLMNRKT